MIATRRLTTMEAIRTAISASLYSSVIRPPAPLTIMFTKNRTRKTMEKQRNSQPLHLTPFCTASNDNLLPRIPSNAICQYAGSTRKYGMANKIAPIAKPKIMMIPNAKLESVLADCFTATPIAPRIIRPRTASTDSTMAIPVMIPVGTNDHRRIGPILSLTIVKQLETVSGRP